MRGGELHSPFQDFTPRAQKVVELARKESDRLHHDFIGTEHLLIGLLDLGQGVAFNVLKRFGIGVAEIRREVERSLEWGLDQPYDSPQPFTPRLKRVIELAQEERRVLRHTYLGTEHLLLGILKENGGIGARVLRRFGLDPYRLRQEILKELDPNLLLPGEDWGR